VEMRGDRFFVSVRCGRLVSRGCHGGVVTVRDAVPVVGGVTSGFLTLAGRAGVGTPFTGRWWRRFRRLLPRIFSRVRRGGARP
jgi:hypothetical protein